MVLHAAGRAFCSFGMPPGFMVGMAGCSCSRDLVLFTVYVRNNVLIHPSSSAANPISTLFLGFRRLILTASKGA